MSLARHAEARHEVATGHEAPTLRDGERFAPTPRDGSGIGG